MAYLDILTDVLTYTGKRISTTEEKDKYKRNINKCAWELHREYDLVGCLREQFFAIDPDEDHITFPWYIWQVRGIRHKDGRFKIDQLDMRPRYQSNAWEPSGFTEWRKLHRVPIAKEPTVAAPLQVSIPFAETSDIIVTITGSITSGVRVTEQITIAAGSLLTNSVNTFDRGNNNYSIDSIAKDRVTTNDVTVKDMAQEEIAIIPNKALHSTYYLYAISSMFGESSHDCEVYEVLYKTAFIPFDNDADEFLADGYDDAIVEKYLEWWYLHIEPNTEKAVVHNTKMRSIILRNEEDSNLAVKLKSDFGRNRFIEAQSNSFNSPYGRYGYGLPHTRY